MRIILFCQNDYAYGILAPVRTVLREGKHPYIWYIPEKLLNDFPFKEEDYTVSILELQLFGSDAILVPGNEVPYHIRGLKVRIFDGLSGDRKEKIKIGHYFDLYLTQDPYFTKKLNELKNIHKNFEVIETEWPNPDVVGILTDFITTNGVPEKRKLSLGGRLKIHSVFGKPVKDPFRGKTTNKISAVLITFNEDIHINAVLENLKFADEIIVVDSNSTDGTIDKIKQHPNVTLILRPFVNYTDQKTFALEQATHDWVLFLDADERIPDNLRNEIMHTVNSDGPTADAYFFYRTFMFKDKILRFSGWQRDKNYRLFKKSKVHFTRDRIVHETLIVDGRSDILKNRLIHYSYKDYGDYKGKMIKYGKMKALEELEKGYDPNPYHFIIRPLYKFLNHYIFRLGILDGKKGIIICYLNALGVYARYKELRRLRSVKQ